MKQNTMTTILIAVIVGAVAFFGGMQYQKSQVRQGASNTSGQRGTRQFGMRGSMATIGQIISQDATSMTIKTADGSSKIVLFSANTVISKTDTGAKSDLNPGQRVAVFGTTNSDGSLTAQNIQLNPMFRTGRQPTP